ncbi:unnamed protein product [Callosobruchus maculatus]|uniref:Uncharacterized protein n=1 Tax=Callosobruchus maculatus TaxID=64391 RepID=A0A653BN61_CALMS|nr:unnamed protein product [Callosobruchus maculatus]
MRGVPRRPRRCSDVFRRPPPTRISPTRALPAKQSTTARAYSRPLVHREDVFGSRSPPIGSFSVLTQHALLHDWLLLLLKFLCFS